MPTDARPVNRPQPVPGTVHYRRVFTDALNRPLVGQVTLTGTARQETGGAVVLPAPVVVKVLDGALEVDLPPDTYRVQASLRTVEGAPVTDTFEVTLA